MLAITPITRQVSLLAARGSLRLAGRFRSPLATLRRSGWSCLAVAARMFGGLPPVDFTLTVRSVRGLPPVAPPGSRRQPLGVGEPLGARARLADACSPESLDPLRFPHASPVDCLPLRLTGSQVYLWMRQGGRVRPYAAACRAAIRRFKSGPWLSHVTLMPKTTMSWVYPRIPVL